MASLKCASATVAMESLSEHTAVLFICWAGAFLLFLLQIPAAVLELPSPLVQSLEFKLWSLSIDMSGSYTRDCRPVAFVCD